MKNDAISELRDLLKKDSTSKHPKYPQQSFFALNDERVVKAMRQRLDNQSTLIGVQALEYDFFSGLNRIFFEFSSHERVGIKAGAILVMIDNACNVVGIIDPFDPVQPNPVLPVLPENSGLPSHESPLPFVLARPSGAKGLPFTRSDLYMLQVRNNGFFQGLGVGELGEADEGDTNSPASTLSSAIILAVPENIDEPVVQTDYFNDDTCSIE